MKPKLALTFGMDYLLQLAIDEASRFESFTGQQLQATPIFDTSGMLFDGIKVELAPADPEENK